MRKSVIRIAGVAVMAAIVHFATSVHAELHYSGRPNHRELATAALQLATAAGFDDAHYSLADIRARLEAGAYCEDFDPIPGIPGVNFPDPWFRFPDLTLGDLLSVVKIPPGTLTDPSSGWARGLPHGYDPLTGFRWPGAPLTTLQWANAPGNTFTWDNAIRFHHEGRYAEAYECLGHLVHLLTDLSIPAHVRVVDHGVHLADRNSGYLVDPDIAVVIVDEYETALQGGLEINGVTDAIPDLLGIFRTALTRARVSDIPDVASWTELFSTLATSTATMPSVMQYYAGPAAEGLSGVCRDASGNAVLPSQLGTISPPVKIGDRWTQFGVFSTVKIPGGTVLPPEDMRILADSLVPKAVAYAAALLLKFQSAVQAATSVGDRVEESEESSLAQNYPNPFNPVTTIRYSVGGEAPRVRSGDPAVGAAAPSAGRVRLAVYDLLGREVALLVDEWKAAGTYAVQWNAAGMPNGVYICSINAGEYEGARMMFLLR